MTFRRRLVPTPGWQLDIAPMIDVVFQLLIFFMLTSSFIAQEGIRVDLPEATTRVPVETTSVVVTVDREDRMAVRGEPVTLEQLRMRLQRARPAAGLLIRADRGASLGAVVRVWDLCRDVGIGEVTIAASGTGGARWAE